MNLLRRYAPLIALVILAAAILLSGASDYRRLDTLWENEAGLRAFVAERRLMAPGIFIAVSPWRPPSASRGADPHPCQRLAMSDQMPQPLQSAVGTSYAS